MGALLGISLWIALATVVPGFVTLAVLYLCLAAAGVDVPAPASEWIMVGVALTVMLLTQALGILLEEWLTRLRWLGPEVQSIWVPSSDVPSEMVEVTMQPYELYRGLYIVLAQLSREEDSQGHLKRAVAQFFLTHNTLVSFGVGVVLSFLLAINAQSPEAERLLLLGVGLLLALGLSYWVAVIRFREMGKSLWAVRMHGRT